MEVDSTWVWILHKFEQVNWTLFLFCNIRSFWPTKVCRQREGSTAEKGTASAWSHQNKPTCSVRQARHQNRTRKTTQLKDHENFSDSRRDQPLIEKMSTARLRLSAATGSVNQVQIDHLLSLTYPAATGRRINRNEHHKATASGINHWKHIEISQDCSQAQKPVQQTKSN